MRVVLVCLARRGGMVHFMAEIAEGLATLARVTAIVSSEADADYLNARVDPVRVKTGGSRLRSLVRLLWPPTWIRIGAILRAARPDVVHITGVHEWNPLVAILCRIERVPLVYTVHDPKPHPGTPWTIRLGDWLTSRMADRLVTLTIVGRRQLSERGESAGRVAVVPLPMYTVFRRWKPRGGRPEKVILYFGRLEAYKGLDVLMRAFNRVRSSVRGWKLIVAGSGRLPDDLGQAAPPQVEIINKYIPDAEVALLMSRCSIVALPYTSATQSGVVALAQAFERPVVATAVGGLNEMVIQGRTGILVPPDDHVALGRALTSLAGDSKRRSRMRREIRRIAAARWEPRVIATAYLDVYASARTMRR